MTDGIEDKVLGRYLGLMKEIRMRVEVVRDIHLKRTEIKYLINNFELAYIQIRKIIEVILMAPILVNEEEYRKVSKNPEFDWRLKQICKYLLEVNDRYYPKPIWVESKGGKGDIFHNVESGFPSSDQLLEIYDYANDFMHFQNPLRTQGPLDADKEWKYIVESVNAINVLLNTHLAYPVAEGRFYFITMETGKGEPGGNLFGIAENT